MKSSPEHDNVSYTQRRPMLRAVTIVGLLVLGLSQTAESASNSAETQKTEESKGVTVEDLARGLKSAAQNIEQEIPKLGAAIGNAVKKITEKEPEKQSPQDPSKEKK
jgi:hypothetical protein